MRYSLSLYTAAILLGLTFWVTPAADPDLGWHLLGGAWMVENRALIYSDFINSFRTEWHDYHWLGEWILFQLFYSGGYILLRISYGFLLAYLCKVILDIILLNHKPRRSELYITLIFLGSVALINQISSIRPQMISLTVLAVALRRLLQEPTKWEIPYLALLTILLVNIHVYWVFIPFLWFFYRCLPRILVSFPINGSYCWGGLAVLSLCGFVSPYGLFITELSSARVLSNYALIWDYMHVPDVLTRSIGELKSSFAIKGWSKWLLLFYIVFIARVFKRAHPIKEGSRFWTMVIGFLLATESVKFIAIFSILSLPYVASHAIGGFKEILPRFIEKNQFNWNRFLVIGVILGSLLSIVTRSPFSNPDDPILQNLYPVDVCRKIATISLPIAPDRKHLRVLTHFDDGGWCKWTAYLENPSVDLRVTTDNRTQEIPEEHFQKAFDLYNAKGEWLTTLQQWNPDAVVTEKIFPLAQFLALAKDQWTLAFQDNSFALFIPKR